MSNTITVNILIHNEQSSELESLGVKNSHDYADYRKGSVIKDRIVMFYQSKNKEQSIIVLDNNEPDNWVTVGNTVEQLDRKFNFVGDIKVNYETINTAEKLTELMKVIERFSRYNEDLHNEVKHIINS